MRRRYLGVIVAICLLTAGLAPAALATTSAGPSPRAKCTITGTSGDDVLRGTSARDVICGLGGDDRIFGLSGHDVLNGGPGHDHLVGGPGNDTLIGGSGNDTLIGGPGSDTTRGGPGTDQVAVGSGTPVPDQTGSSRPPTCATVNAVHSSGVASTSATAAAAVSAGFQLPIVDQALFNNLLRAAPTLDQQVNGVLCAVVVAPAPPSSVRDLKATATSSASVRLEWKAPAFHADGVAYLVSGSGAIDITGTTAEISGLSPLTAYGYSVTAVNSDGASAPVSVSVTTHAAPPPPSGGGSSLLTTTNNKSTGITARMQWNANSGYCGETSFITALMRNGGYASQWTVRSLAAAGNSQENANSQLIIGTNGWGVTDQQVATAMKLVAVDYDNSSETDTDQFLAWIKQRVVADDTVIIGVYNNINMLGETSDDDTYDHIVPVVGVGSNHSLSGASASTYYADDIITISDNGLYTPGPDDVPGNSPENAATSALYTFNVDDWQNYRAGANSGSTVRDLYSAPILIPPPSSSEVLNWGTAITGIVDDTPGGPVAIPVQLTASLDGEGFHNQTSMGAPPTPSALTLTAHARPVDGVEYNVYIYEDFDDVPSGSFNEAALDESRVPDYTIPSDNDGEWSQTITTDTSQTRIFRIVPQSAP